MIREQKRCHFCDKTVNVNTEGGMTAFQGCNCCGSGGYTIESELYDKLNAVSPAQKRTQFYLLSGLIRESADTGREAVLTEAAMDSLLNSPLIPSSVEEKMEKCLLFLHRHASGPDDPVLLQPIEASYNITYSPNLQEFIYIVEQLKDEKLLVRRGATLSLTEKGWHKAAEYNEARCDRKCYIAMALEEGMRGPFEAAVLPKLRENGFEPVSAAETDAPAEGAIGKAMPDIRSSDLMIADFTGQAQQVYFEAGYAKGLGLQVIGTVHKEPGDSFDLSGTVDKAVVWETPEDLADQLEGVLAAASAKIKRM